MANGAASSVWTLDVKDPREWEGWRTVASKPSVEACKAYARRKHWIGGQGVPRFRLYDPQGRLFQVSAGEGTGLRMRWSDGGLYSRERMAQADAYFASDAILEP